MFENRYVIGFCCTAVHKEPVKPFFKALTERINVRNDCFLLVYQCFDELYYHNPETVGASSVFEAINYDMVDVMIVMKTSENQGKYLAEICNNCNARNVPVISIDEAFPNTFNISYCYGEAFSEIVRHIIVEHGCKRIKHVAGLRENDFSQTRIDACASVMAEYGLKLEEKDILYGEFWDEPTYRVMDEFFRSGEELPDAFVCANDSMAMAVCQKLAEKGYAVPDDVIVTGFDGVEIEKYHSPRLTTAARDYVTVVDGLIKLIDDIRSDSTLKPYTIPFSYVNIYSESCGCKAHDSVKSSKMLTDYVRNYAYVRGFEENMNKMGNRIAIDPSVENARETMRRFAFGGTIVCINEQYNTYTSASSNASEEELKILSATPTDDMFVFLECVERAEGGIEGRYFKRSEIIPDLKDRIPGNNILLIIPLYSGRFVIGYFTTYYVGFETFFEQLYMFNSMANRCLEVVHTHEQMRFLNRKMEYMFTHDHLTAIYNRYGFYKNFKADFAGVEREDIFIASVDLNDMKYINETFGHSEGDEALRMTAKALTLAAKETDDNIICSRFGGDEFVVAMLCNGDAKEKSEQFHNNFDTVLEEINSTSGKKYKVSASIGLSCASVSEIESIDELIDLADVMMYNDKARHKRRPKNYKPVTDE
ncbi:MAG: GGDEF domain-containing protein [Ruminiclostridium sp.]|nr:GGDEF domain-containing protein [Ruminiclostridium sp.]